MKYHDWHIAFSDSQKSGIFILILVTLLKGNSQAALESALKPSGLLPRRPAAATQAQHPK